MSQTFSVHTLPNRFDFETAQKKWYECWELNRYFHSEPDPNRKPFTIVIPPPNVTGALHLGHALNNSLQDIMVRFKRMQGFNTLWMPGTDHAGIATQAVVERRLHEEEGKTRHDLGREKLVERIWKWKDAYETRIIDQLKQMGCSCDWERTRFTLDDTCATAVRQTFFDLFKQQRLYRGKRLVNWDTFLQTAVSDDEVFHEPVKGHFWHISYRVIDPKQGEPQSLTIATTRPETLLGDTAVAVHPDPEGALDALQLQLEEKLASVTVKEKPFIQAELDNISERRKTKLAELKQLRDMALDGRMLELPLLKREIPLIADEWAKPEMGSGCVKITPAHDANDYEVGGRCHLPMINILNPDGTMNANAGPYKGLTIKKCRTQVVEDLEASGQLIQVEDRDIELAHSDRSKTPIEPYLADQWFVKMAELAQSAMDAVSDERVKIFPPRYRKGYLDWLGEKRDWPVSRQLWWGHRIPVWMISGNKSALTSSALPHIKELDFKAGPQAATDGLSDRISSFIGEGPKDGEFTIYSCVAPGHDELESQLEVAGMSQEIDVLDTWFSSALWTHSTLGWPKKTAELEYYYPTSTLITSRDIITLWVARMVLAGLNNMNEVPFKEVFIHPKILDGYGETMSKSKGNGVDPVDVIQKFGADALRFGIAHLTTDTQDVRMPVQFECPHCSAHIEQTKKNRTLTRIKCKSCQKEFSTQWASSDEDNALPRGAVVSERFELARNFCNKLWNVSRLILINLEDYSAAPTVDDDLAFEDRWILSRLTTVNKEMTSALETYHYAEAARVVYDFAWDEFCSFYAEMAKPRFENAESRPTAQRVIAYVLDNLLRLLHPMIPFITEEVWSLLGQVAPSRGLSELSEPTEHLAAASWPSADEARQDPILESQFATFQSVLGAIREIRSRQGIAPKEQVEFSVRCDANTVTLLEPMSHFFLAMAKAKNVGWGQNTEAPKTNATVSLKSMDVFVDLKDFIDVEAERDRIKKQIDRLEKSIMGKENKLSNASFVERAPADVVGKEREGLADLKSQLESAQHALQDLEGK